MLRIADNRLVTISDVTGKDDLSSFLSLSQPYLRTGRTKQMSCVCEAYPDPVTQFHFLSVFQRYHMAHGFLHVRQRVERFYRLLAGAGVAFGFPRGVAFLDVGGIPQHDGEQMGGQSGTVNIAGKTELG